MPPVRYHDWNGSYPAWFAQGLQFDWTPLAPSYDPLYDLSGHHRHMVCIGSGIRVDTASSVHEGLPCIDHLVDTGYLSHPRIPGFDLEETDIWTVGLRWSIRNSSVDERTLFAKRVEGGSTHLLLRTNNLTDPTNIEIYIGGTREGVSLRIIELNTPYVTFMRNRGTGAANGWDHLIYDTEGTQLDQLFAANSYSANRPEAPFWLCANQSAGNDPMEGLHAGARAWDRVLSEWEMQALAYDWHLPYRSADRAVVDEPGAPPTFQAAWAKRAPQVVGAA